jgi:hypothetical protein
MRGRLSAGNSTVLVSPQQPPSIEMHGTPTWTCWFRREPYGSARLLHEYRICHESQVCVPDEALADGIQNDGLRHESILRRFRRMFLETRISGITIVSWNA